MDTKNKITMSAYGIAIAAMLVDHSIIQQVIAQGNATSHNATSSAAGGNATLQAIKQVVVARELNNRMSYR